MEKKYYNFKDLGNEYKNIENFGVDCSKIQNFSVENGGECCNDLHCDSMKCLTGNCCNSDDNNCKSCDSSGDCESCKSDYVLQNGECTDKFLLKSEDGESCIDNAKCATNMCKGKCCNKDVYDNNYLCAECDSTGNCIKCPTSSGIKYEFLENNVCGLRKSKGDKCTGNKDCKSLKCVGGICKVPVGEICKNDNECVSNVCLTGTCCKERYENCEECVANKRWDHQLNAMIIVTERVGECGKCKGFNRLLNDRTCGIRKDKGESCNGNFDCVSENCNNGTCDESKIESCRFSRYLQDYVCTEKKLEGQEVTKQEIKSETKQKVKNETEKENNCNYKDHCYNSKCRTDNSDKPWCYLKENSKDICKIDGGSGYGNVSGKNYSYDACANWVEETKDEVNNEIKEDDTNEIEDNDTNEIKEENNCNFKDHCQEEKCRTDNHDKPWCYLKENSKDICNIDGGKDYGNSDGKFWSEDACKDWKDDKDEQEINEEKKEKSKEIINLDTKSNLNKNKIGFLEKNKLILFIIGVVLLFLIILIM